MIRRRARAAGIKTEICNHTFRATGITSYLKNGGRLEIAQQMANHESARTTGPPQRRRQPGRFRNESETAALGGADRDLRASRRKVPGRSRIAPTRHCGPRRRPKSRSHRNQENFRCIFSTLQHPPGSSVRPCGRLTVGELTNMPLTTAQLQVIKALVRAPGCIGVNVGFLGVSQEHAVQNPTGEMRRRNPTQSDAYGRSQAKPRPRDLVKNPTQSAMK